MEANKEQTEATGSGTAGKSESVPETNATETEFKIEIRKLEVPVRPRGVLAE
jgi:hypothetical protein